MLTVMKSIMVKQVGDWLKGFIERNVNSHIFKHSIETDHPTVTIDDFGVLKTSYRQKNLEESYPRLDSSFRINPR